MSQALPSLGGGGPHQPTCKHSAGKGGAGRQKDTVDRACGPPGGHAHSAQVLCSVSGKTLWSQPSSFGGNASVLSPLLRVPDLDADGAPDLLVLVQEENQVPPHPSCAASPSGLLQAPKTGRESAPRQSRRRSSENSAGAPHPPALNSPRRPASGLSPVSSTHAAQVNGYIYSGGTGQQVSPPDSLGVDGTSGSILHVTRAGAHYVLVPCGTWRPQPQDSLLHGPAGTRVEAGVGLAVPLGMRGSHPLRGDQAFLCSQALPSAAAP